MHALTFRELRSGGNLVVYVWSKCALMDIALDSLNRLGVVALCLLAFSWSLRTMKVSWQQNLLAGLVFGLGAIASMLQPVMQLDGYQADGRYLFLVLVSAFGGPLAGAVAVGMSILVRAMIGGHGAPAGMLLILLCSVMAALWGYATQRTRKRGAYSWLILSLIASFPIGIGFTLVYPDNPFPAAVRIIFTLICIFLFGKLLETEVRRTNREKELDKAVGLDFLTQLPNRRALNDRLSSSLMHDGKAKAFLVIDIDHFKAINDEHGHIAGDEVLKKIGAKLKTSMRPEDFVARMGGEEFAVILCAQTRTEAMKVAERIRAGLKGDISVDGKTIKVTASLGGTFVKNSEISGSSAFQIADQALYAAKRAGRDQMVFTTESADNAEPQFPRVTTAAR